MNGFKQQTDRVFTIGCTLTPGRLDPHEDTCTGDGEHPCMNIGNHERCALTRIRGGFITFYGRRYMEAPNERV